MELRLGDRLLTLERSRVMGILNVTPDSFSDGGQFLSVEAALAQAVSMWEQQADIIDVGGESTRPGAAALPVQQELDRILPWLEKATEHEGSWWPDWSEWLCEQSGEKIPPRIAGSGKLAPIEDAPGSYVTSRKPGDESEPEDTA